MGFFRLVMLGREKMEDASASCSDGCARWPSEVYTCDVSAAYDDAPCSGAFGDDTWSAEELSDSVQFEVDGRVAGSG